MKNNFCTGCGTPLRSDMKICPNCGKLTQAKGTANKKPTPQRPVQPQRTVQQRPTAQRQVQRTVQRPVQPRPVRQTRPEPVPAEPIKPSREQKRAERAEKAGRRKKRVQLFFRLATAAVVIAAVYVVLSAVSVFRVKTADYDFQSQMTMSKKNYGQAIEGYFDGGSWTVNPFNATVTFKGESIHNEEYEIVFGAGVKVSVKEITVDGKDYKGKAIETKIMGMFI
ncbi:MAG: hypothetical protein ACI4JW_04065 [Oscillospiraceae bacterium]